MSEYIDTVFGPKGILARRFDGYAPRSGQIEMTRAVDAAMREGRHLLAEAPTGTGKGVAYGVPATHHAVHRKRRVLMVTANIALQEQLVDKDLPQLAEILPWDFRFALLKGKSNYLCHDKRYQEEADGTLHLLEEPGDSEQLSALIQWARSTEHGDVNELPFKPEYRLWRRFSTTSDDCKGSDCPFRDECCAAKAKARAQDAHVVVTNYHLLFAHLQVKEATGEDLVLPGFDVAVLDEGHKAADIARDFFGFRLSPGTLRWASRLLKKLGEKSLFKRLNNETERFFRSLAQHRRSPEYKARLRRPNVAAWEDLSRLLGLTTTAYTHAAAGTADEELANEFGRVAARTSGINAQLRAAMTLADHNSVVFVEEDMRGQAILRSKPIDVSERLKSGLFDACHSVVLTSATLTTGGSFEHIAEEVGVPAPQVLSVDSPFDYEQNALLVVPRDLPPPPDVAYPVAVADTVAEVVELGPIRVHGLQIFPAT